jgi:serine-type D-Ala-D-Ala carboxypeptidase/endopeptidase
MKGDRGLLTAIAALLLGLAANAQSDTSQPQGPEIPGHPGLAARVDALAQPLVDDGLTVGMVIGVLQGDQSWIRGYGEIALGGGQRPGADTVYEIGSVSKVFTGILLADAEKRELVNLDDSVADVLPVELEFPLFKDQPIRLWHLSTHTSGLPRMPRNLKPKDSEAPYEDYTMELLYEFLEGYRLRRAPGKTFMYSNLGVGLLGNCLAMAQDLSYEQLLAERIAGPLGLKSTGIELSESMKARLAPGYDVDRQPKPNWDMPVFNGAGGIRSDMTDMLRFARANLHPDETPIEEALILAQEIKHKDERGTQIALGWLAASGGATRWHNGQTGGYHTYLCIWPDKDCAVALFANTTWGHMTTCADSVLLMLVGEEPHTIKYEKPIALPREDLEAFVGEYKLSFLAKMSVTLEADGLWAQVSLQPKLRLYPSGPSTFFYRAVEAEVHFKKDDQGQVPGLEIHQGGTVTQGERKSATKEPKETGSPPPDK